MDVATDSGCCVETDLFSHGLFKPFHSTTHTDKDLPMLPHYHNNTASLSPLHAVNPSHTHAQSRTRQEMPCTYSQEAVLSVLNGSGKVKGQQTRTASITNNVHINNADLARLDI